MSEIDKSFAEAALYSVDYHVLARDEVLSAACAWFDTETSNRVRMGEYMRACDRLEKAVKAWKEMKNA